MIISALLRELTDVPEECLNVALADAVFRLDESDARATAGDRRFEHCLHEAQMIRSRLQKHGFEIVRIAVETQGPPRA